MATLFISDLHLNADQPELTQQFIALLQEAEKKAEAVYILGDLFDRWVGDDDTAAFLQSIYQSLQQLTQTIPCYFIAGNRDFLIGEIFQQQTGVQLLTEPYIISLYSVPTLLMHGDLLCIEDIKYQAYRQKVRQPQAKRRFLSLPLFFRKMIVYSLRLLSRRHQKKQNLEYLDANQMEILTQMENHGVHQLIYGHTHQPGIHLYWEDNQLKRWWVLGDWGEKHCSFLWIYPDQSYQLRYSTAH